MTSTSILTLMIAGLAAAPAFAQQAPARSVVLDQITLTANGRDSAAPVDGIVATDSATATKSGQPLIATPASVTVVGSAEVARRGGARNVGEALSYAAGVVQNPAFAVTSDSTISLRGFGTWGSNFLDGLKVGTGMTRSGQPTVEPYGIERFEVLRGPASVLYGQVSPGGMINTVSKRPTLSNSREGFTQVGSYGRVQTGMDVNGINADGTLGWRFVGFAQKSRTQMDDVDDNRVYLAPSLTWVPTDATTLTLLGSWRSLRGAEWANGAPRPAMEAVDTGFNPGHPGFDRRDSDQWSLGYELKHRFAPNLELEQNLRFRRMDGTYHQVFAWDGLTNNPARPLEVAREAYKQDQTVDTFDVDTRLRWVIEGAAARHEIIAGVDYTNIRTKMLVEWGKASPLDFGDPSGAPRIIGPFRTQEFDNEWKRETGVYVQDTTSIGNWRLTGGLRWSRTTNGEAATDTSWNYERKQKAVVGNFGVLYEVPNGLSPYFSFAQSFQPETGTDWQGKPFEPTRAEQFEAGVKYQPPGSDMLLTAALFQITRQNMLTADPDHPRHSKQVGEARMRGLELEGRMQRGDWQASLAYTLLDSEITRTSASNKGNQLSAVPRHTASVWLNWAPQSGAAAGVRLGGGVRASSASWGDDANTIRNASLTRLDLAAGYDFGVRDPRLDGLRVDLNLSNLGAKKDELTCSRRTCEFVEQPTASLTLGFRF